jgi:hypothetical protein
MAKERTPIPEDVAAEVLYQHNHTCCVCTIEGRQVQIHHINENPTDHRPENLAVLCHEDHGRTQTRGGFGRHLRAAEVMTYRDSWLKRVVERRARADDDAVRVLGGVHAEPPSPAEDWKSPGTTLLVAMLEALINGAQRALREERAATGETTVEMKMAAYRTTDIFGNIWVQIAAWFPPYHFGATPKVFIEAYVASRARWFAAIYDPGNIMMRGTIAGLEIDAKIREELITMIEDTAVSAADWEWTKDNHFKFDVEDWRRRWRAATR